MLAQVLTHLQRYFHFFAERRRHMFGDDVRFRVRGREQLEVGLLAGGLHVRIDAVPSAFDERSSAKRRGPARRT